MIKPHLELVEINAETEPMVGLLYRPSELVSQDLESKERCAVFFHGNTMNFCTGAGWTAIRGSMGCQRSD